MLYNYILDNYKKGEPIFLDELPGKSRDSIRQEMKKLVDEGKLERMYNGVYYVPYTTILGTQGKVSTDKFIEKKYISNNGKIIGYVTGLQLANMYGFTTQVPACYELRSNEATTKQRKRMINGIPVIVYKPIADITVENKDALQFLDLMLMIDRYSELTGEELILKLSEYVKKVRIDFATVKKYISLYPDKVYRNIYNGGLMNELI